MSKQNTVLPLAYELTDDYHDNLSVLKVPIQWQQIAQSLATKRAKITNKYPSVPVYSLDTIITACFPQIIKTLRNGWQKPHHNWLIAKEKVDLSLLANLVKYWLQEEFNYCLKDEVEKSLSQLDNSLWQWENDVINYSFKNPEKIDYNDLRFQVIPDYIAHSFLENPIVSFGHNQEYELTFYPVVNIKQSNTVELMSWLPNSIPLIKNKTENIGNANLSFVINFSLQTIPWRQQPIIYISLSIRRWLTQPFEKIPYKGMTIYVGDNHRWLDGISQPFSFIPLSIKYQNYSKTHLYPYAISELLKLNQIALPELNDLIADPQFNWYNPVNNSCHLQIAIAYDNRQGDQPCLAGVSALDLASLELAIKDKINEGILPLKRLANAYKRSGTYQPFWGKVKSQKQGDKTPKDANDLATPMLRPKIVAPAVFSPRQEPIDTILIIWETAELRDGIIEEICSLLQVEPQGNIETYQTQFDYENEPVICEGNAQIYHGKYGSICLKTQHVSNLTQNFDISGQLSIKERKKLRDVQLQARIEAIKKFLPPTKTLAGLIVEIKKKAFISEADPKIVWRIAPLQVGYLNQHIQAITGINQETKESYNLNDGKHRIKGAISDLIRQFGILPAPLIKDKIDNIYNICWLTCFYVIRRTKKTTVSNLPNTVVLMLRVNSLTGIIQVTTPSIKNQKEETGAETLWVSYPSFLQALLTEKWDPDAHFEENNSEDIELDRTNKQKEQKLIESFVSDCLKDCLNTPIAEEKQPRVLNTIVEEKQPRVLFMAEAHNARNLLTFLQNPSLPRDNLPLFLTKNMNKSEQNRLCLVRLRTNNNNEVPVTIVKDNTGGKISNGALFDWQNITDQIDPNSGIYLSLRKMLNTEQGTNSLQKEQSRLDDGNKQAANPQPLEIIIIKKWSGLIPETIACFIHNLRDRYPYFAKDTILPLPFPFAIKAREYAVSLKDQPETSEIEE